MTHPQDITMQTPLIIVDRNYLLREFCPADIPHIHAIASSEGFFFYNLDKTAETAKRLVHNAIATARAPLRTSFKLAIDAGESHGGKCTFFNPPRHTEMHHKDGSQSWITRPPASSGNHCIGYVAFDGLDTEEPDIGYFIAPSHQGQGIATNTMAALIKYVYNHHAAVDKVTLTVHPENIASQRVADKLTFQPTGAHTTIQTIRGEEPRISFATNRERFFAHYG